eukprot:TRINITY_DN780187_c0_g1_i1.p1 TRINITY_DN780187_c0_g1~~TRINITY_DN780187_c0_g1_i1.p1  ORF type:complete len:211 (+),score=53.70 TRINITY_DN780187_c0_g1_i1:114-746(+)
MPAKRKKGMSMDEKVAVVVRILQENRAPMDKTELSDAVKAAGVAFGTVDAAIKNAIGEITSEKIGSKNFFWAFTSDDVVKEEHELNKLETEYAMLQERTKKVEDEVTELTKVRCDEDRADQLEDLAEYKEQAKEIQDFLDEHKGDDPETLKEVIGKMKVMKEAVERWTDNTWLMESWLKKKFPNVQKKDINQLLHLNDDFDYPNIDIAGL